MCGSKMFQRMRKKTWDLPGMVKTGWPNRRPAELGSSGNSAFDAYVEKTLAELERQRQALVEEEKAFAAFLEKLRYAKDREEFDRFMAERNTPQSEAA